MKQKQIYEKDDELGRTVEPKGKILSDKNSNEIREYWEKCNSDSRLIGIVLNIMNSIEYIKYLTPPI